MRSLVVKLTLAFLLIGITGAALVAVIMQQRTSLAFNQFIVNQQQETLAKSLVAYYEEHGGWLGVGENLNALLNAPRGFDGGGSRPPRGGDRFLIVAADQTVVYSGDPNQVGQPVPARDLENAQALTTSTGALVGWLVLPQPNPQLSPGSPENRFLNEVNHASMLSALVAALLALTLGGLLAYTMTRSLRELTEATESIAAGKLGLQVRVRSKDEIGELAMSFNQMSRDLERATAARRQMTADIAHDLRSPLSVISGYAEALSDGKLPGTAEVYEILHNETQHLSRLIDDLRTLSLADAGELPLALQAASPQALLERLAARHTLAAAQRQIALRVEASAGLPDVQVDVERMAQVLDNLITNAFRYTPAGGEIVLSARHGEGGVQLEVRDNGAGIAPEDLPHVFDRFYRGDKARQQSAESGLGLAIARSIVEAHRGAIRVESRPGEGATFTISLPAQAV